jgi:predicted acylesterase/phospholipase RssA
VSSAAPSLAAAEGTEPPSSLVLAGGGMRVAYQAGVLLALEEEGIRFTHADGTSGGTINLAMLLSGLSPDEMCERWRSLSVKDFGSPLPLHEYLEVTDLPALGDADGVVNKVFPHLGIDVERIRASRGLEATFNACNYTRKTNEAVPHTEVDLELLVAGISLPIFMPPVRRGSDLYTDSVWIKDANLTEAVRRGSEEIWLVWCIGNTGIYRNGAFNQYVHMIELAANGSLFEEFDRIRELNEGRERPLRLHVIRPEFPIPLDPDFYLGRIDAESLLEIGYGDAKRYLAVRPADGIPWTPEATRMRDPVVGISFRETMTGELAGAPVTVSPRVRVRDVDAFVAGPVREGEVTGYIESEPLGGRALVKHGVFSLSRDEADPPTTTIDYTLAFDRGGVEHMLTARKELRDDPGFDLMHDVTHVEATLVKGAETIGSTTLRSDLTDLAHSVHAWDVESERERLAAITTFGRFFLGRLWETLV